MNSPLLKQEFGPSSSTSNLLPSQGNSGSSPYCDGLLSPTQSRSPSPSPYANSLSDQYSLKPNPQDWGAHALNMGTAEPDDYLHNPDPKRDLKSDKGGHIFTARGIANLGCLLLLVVALIGLFLVIPFVTHLLNKKQTTQGGFNLGGINSTGQLPSIPGGWGLIDVDTPKEVYTKASYTNPSEQLELNDLEWYDPSAVTTKGGALAITLSKEDPVTNHNLSYKSGMIQSCWTMGNLGRAGFGASLDGLWPYSYDSCDVGTLPNQTYPGTEKPLAATENGDPDHGGVLVSQSAQWAPFNAAYQWLNTSDNFKIYDPTITELNSYHGGKYAFSILRRDCYELDQRCYSVYGFEYVPGFDNGYITWISDDKAAWTVMAGGVGPDSLTEISARPIPQEPMYIIANLGFSINFGGIDFENIELPATMLVDYIRVYQPANAKNIGCDPPDFPTAAYINTYMEAYTNFNLTTWAEFNQTNPKNRLMDTC
ncbi:hypothetical protein ID866_4009 [Astraeus odoratus]|nr:hypothetical protein ID866_4009 [Astraeus odoratus]